MAHSKGSTSREGVSVLRVPRHTSERELIHRCQILVVLSKHRVNFGREESRDIGRINIAVDQLPDKVASAAVIVSLETVHIKLKPRIFVHV